MSKEKLIQIEQLCVHYQVEMSLFSELQDFGIIEILTIEDSYFIHEDKISVVEKVVRMQKDLNINMEGIDTVMNLLDKINDLQTELNTVKNRLRLYED
ncbi:MAG: MerR family transcriptional regulator [Vicingus serpentipes]|nr:MerR family transcriptional regulator [Vicingus serpentipes]